jgi:hypothetical protein
VNILGYVILRQPSLTDRALLNDAVLALVPSLLHSSSYCRILSQLILLELMASASDCVTKLDSPALRRISAFIRDNKECQRFREKFGKYFDALDPDVEGTVRGMASNQDWVNEVVPLNLFDKVKRVLTIMAEEEQRQRESCEDQSDRIESIAPAVADSSGILDDSTIMQRKIDVELKSLLSGATDKTVSPLPLLRAR